MWFNSLTNLMNFETSAIESSSPRSSTDSINLPAFSSLPTNEAWMMLVIRHLKIILSHDICLHMRKSAVILDIISINLWPTYIDHMIPECLSSVE